ncbi:MAG: hypothetical protein WCD12_16865 [Candidatus Binatus sp.]|uniref:hypothetical protein n=1 Tax=Candidatus Binatus sp. TaxID=2811406 RepID=UPI003C709E38
MKTRITILLALALLAGCAEQPDKCAPLTDQAAQQICYQTAEMRREHANDRALNSLQRGADAWRPAPVNFTAVPHLNPNP